MLVDVSDKLFIEPEEMLVEVTEEEIKKIVIDWVQNKYKNSSTPFDYKTTPQGNPVPGTDDRADAIVVALAGLKE
jgi:hypothetical protein